MIQRLINSQFLAFVGMVIVTVLLWGLTFSPSYAAVKTEVTYYAFVMHKPKEASSWQLPNSATLGEGFYRFQIVGYENSRNQWYALRGEFHFIKDKSEGGVKLDKQNTLDASDAIDGTPKTSLWSVKVKNWGSVIDDQLQPIIEQMRKKNRTGSADPNFMRFLIKKRVEDTWEVGGKKYHLYRIHNSLNGDNSVKDENSLKALSRFINPSEAPTTDIATLKKWINDQTGFESARYLGEANEQLKEFYKSFSEASKQFLNKVAGTKNIADVDNFIKGAKAEIAKAKAEIAKAKTTDLDKNAKDEAIQNAENSLSLAENKIVQANTALTQADQSVAEEKIQNAEDQINTASDEIEDSRQELEKLNKNNLLSLFLGILIVVIIGIAIWPLFFAKTIEHKNGDGDEDFYPDESENDARYPRSSKIDGIFQLFSGWLTRTEKNSKRKRHNKSNRSKQNKRLNVDKANKPYQPVASSLSRPKDVLPVAAATPVDYVSKNELATVVKHEVSNSFNHLFKENLQQEPQQEALKVAIKTPIVREAIEAIVEKIVKNAVANYLNSQNFQDFIAKKLKSQLAEECSSRNFLEEKNQGVPKTPPVRNRRTEPTTNDVIDKIKTVLLSMKSVDEATLNTLDTTVHPCTFVTNVVGSCLKLNQPVTHYQRLDNAIGELTASKVSLIISNIGDDIRPEEHNIVGQQTVTKGKLNVVASLIRPGVRCDNAVRRKAEVIQNA